jgi:sugar phosphate isomerase/epimerase
VDKVAAAADRRGLNLWLETGQETPTTLLRCLRDLDADPLGINFDPANLVMYGKANPLDAMDQLGPWVRGFHAKDGRYPIDPRLLGEETPLGRGVVDFPRFIEKLRKHRYAGAVTIEREITGLRQQRELRAAIRYLRPLL